MLLHANITNMNVIGFIAFFNLLNLIISQDIYYEGFKEFDKCLTTSGFAGVCRYQNNCTSLDAGKISGEIPKFCGYVSGTFALLICCPKLAALTRLAQQAVTAPVVKFDCGYRGHVAKSRVLNRTKRRLNQINIVGGEDSKFIAGPLILPGDYKGEDSEFIEGPLPGALLAPWPWMVLLGEGKGASGLRTPNFFCSGALINEKFILTAAHCLLDIDDFFLRFGELDYKDLNDGPPPLDIEAGPVIFHPKYESQSGYNDLAIVKLSQKVNITDSIRPICIPWDADSHLELINTNAIVTGWGSQNFGGPRSHKLQEVTVKIFSSSVCERNYSTLPDYQRRFPMGIKSENILCAGDVEGGKDACQGDSGAPLSYMKPDTKQYFLAGIVSKGYGCGHKDFPGLYAPVRNQLNLQWIKDVAFSKD